MEAAGVQQARIKAATASLKIERTITHDATVAAPPKARKPAGYGLPCSKCRMYYPADMDCCPVCNTSERVSAASDPAYPAPAVGATPVAIRPDMDDRDRLIKELKSQIYQAHTQINASASFRCCMDQNHEGNSEPAAVCHSCYAEARQQADRFEAALHMDLKEAARIVYEAVWADSSDPSKTYQNAAAALLTELRKRAGIGLLLGSNQPLAH